MNKTVSSFELFNPTYTKYFDTPLYSPISVFQPETGKKKYIYINIDVFIKV